jgi:hypothetical protein
MAVAHWSALGNFLHGRWYSYICSPYLATVSFLDDLGLKRCWGLLGNSHPTRLPGGAVSLPGVAVSLPGEQDSAASLLSFHTAPYASHKNGTCLLALGGRRRSKGGLANKAIKAGKSRPPACCRSNSSSRSWLDVQWGWETHRKPVSARTIEPISPRSRCSSRRPSNASPDPSAVEAPASAEAYFSKESRAKSSTTSEGSPKWW